MAKLLLFVSKEEIQNVPEYLIQAFRSGKNVPSVIVTTDSYEKQNCYAVTDDSGNTKNLCLRDYIETQWANMTMVVTESQPW